VTPLGSLRSVKHGTTEVRSLRSHDTKTDGDAAAPRRLPAPRTPWSRWPLIYIAAACGLGLLLAGGLWHAALTMVMLNQPSEAVLTSNEKGEGHGHGVR
jgi:hypothetical protein